ncbi:Flp family type IVb pilin [Sandarakinorhabdus sp.]|uniref:Flp family type IVb pilin n=1 Tax=Sandarakinorhabdus sp. TaxID=1916663 RepID=UPI003340868C
MLVINFSTKPLFKAISSRRSQRGATALEYALVLAFVAVGVLAALNTLSGSLKTTIGGVGTTVAAAPAAIK